MRTIIIASITLVTFAAQAAVYKCEQPNGVIKYQATPCVGGEQFDTRHAGQADAQAAEQANKNLNALANQYKAKIQAGAERRHREAVQARAQIAHKQRVKELIREHQIAQGMTTDEVRRSWGPPSRINQSTNGDQWVYEHATGTSYVHFGADELVSSASSYSHPNYNRAYYNY